MAQEETPKRRRGGQELPDDVQDRPEQNAGYDAAVRGADVPPGDTKDESAVDEIADGGGIDQISPEWPAPRRTDDVDDRAERDVIAEVRRRERSNR
jgi:hypothetical protein